MISKLGCTLKGKHRLILHCVCYNDLIFLVVPFETTNVINILNNGFILMHVAIVYFGYSNFVMNNIELESGGKKIVTKL